MIRRKDKSFVQKVRFDFIKKIYAIKDVQAWWTDQQNLEAYGFTKISNEIDLSSYWY